jgi:rSAM/selenodomain-associated transferase 2/rSAM/selenodomain-associated transferase 1
MNRVIKELAVLPGRVIVFTRYPEPGVTKTRMIPALGAERAAQLQLALTKRTLLAVHDLCLEYAADVEVRFAGGSAEQMADVFGSDRRYQPQEGSDLGERLVDAFSNAFAEGAERVVVIGSDCPGLDGAVLKTAMEALSLSDVVLGPALDGGYYLIGLTQNQPQLFRSIDWGSESVMHQTIGVAKQSRCSVQLLQPLSDVDYPEDLMACRRYPVSFVGVLPQMRAGVLSIIIPTLNEEQRIEETLSRIVGHADIEVIVADGGSEDATRTIAERMDARVIVTSAGRGRQLNAGAAIASGDVLLFLHADCRLPDGYHDLIRSTLSARVIAGAFTLSIDGDRTGLRLIEQGVKLRSKLLGRPYGDQGIFLRSDWFFRMDGFPNWPILEDVELCRRIRKHGKISIASAAITTSARRWMKLGLWRTTMLNQICLIGFYLGVSPETLNRWYRSRH